MEGITALPVQDIGDGLNVHWVLESLNQRNCFDFEFVPQENDWISIARTSKNWDTPFMNFNFEGGKWVEGWSRGFEDYSQLLNQGKLEFAEKTRLNTLRSYLISELDDIANRWAPEAVYLRVILHQVEQLSLELLENEGEASILLEMIVAETNSKHFPDGLPDSKLIQKLGKKLISLVSKPQKLPTVPLRRVLTPLEWHQVWEQFNQKLAKMPRSFVCEEARFHEEVQAISSKQTKLYNLDGFRADQSYELSSSWLATMLEGDLSFWMDADFTWAIHPDGNGYYYTMGDIGPF